MGVLYPFNVQNCIVCVNTLVLLYRKEEDGSQEKHIDYLTYTTDSDEGGSEAEQSDGDSESQPGCDETAARLPNPLAPEPLPSVTTNNPGVSSVFVNAFKEAEQAKHLILEQHVKMTAEQIKESRMKKKQMCYNYQKGKCRFGSRCKYSHGDNITSDKPNDGVLKVKFTRSPKFPLDAETNDDGEVIMRKRRAGMTNNLLPAKKSRETLDKQRAQERPWTMQGN